MRMLKNAYSTVRSYSMNRCICKKEISEWLFNFSQDEEKFEKNNVLGEKLKLMLLEIRNSCKSKSKFGTIISNIEHKQDLRKWFLRKIKKYTHKICYGWQCKFKIIKINKKCKIHRKRGLNGS